MDLVVADDRTVPLSKRYENLRIKPEGSQKEQGGGGRAVDAREDGCQPRSIGSVGCMITRCHVQIEQERLGACIG